MRADNCAHGERPAPASALTDRGPTSDQPFFEPSVGAELPPP